MLTNGLCVLVLADDATHRELIAGSVRTSLPTAEIAFVEPALLDRRQMPEGNSAVIAPKFGSRNGADALMALRATGFTGPAIVLVASAEESPIEIVARESGASAVVFVNDAATRLPEALAEMMSVNEDAPAIQELRRAQRLMATGAVAAGFQHAVNNPLTALLAEAQLLAMEPLEDEHRAAAERIVEHTRRVIATVAQLKVIASERKNR